MVNPETVEKQLDSQTPFDLAACQECLSEVRDQSNRRYRYAFTCCSLCGPRFTVTDVSPYHQPGSPQPAYPICRDCRTEFEDSSKRRHHARFSTCPKCGPQLTLVNALGSRIPGDPMETARQLLHQGQILAVRELGGFHLAVDASKQAAVRRLRKRKERPRKPLALLSSSLPAIEGFAQLEPGEVSLIRSNRGPIVLVRRREPFPLPDEIAPGKPRIGVMLAYTPLLHLLAEGFIALAVTSGNLKKEPIVSSNHQALKKLENLADAFLIHDREVVTTCDDSVVYQRGERTAFVRRSRGYVPEPVLLPGATGEVLAVGAQLGNTFCLTRNEQAFLSQHMGGLENLEAYDQFLDSLNRMKELLRIHPTLVACDLHPDYLSTRYAEQLSGVRVEKIQHHHAHLAACMADNQLTGEVIGLCLDGGGLGEDGTMWGGEVLVGGYREYRRAARLKPFRLPGGDKAIQEPWRATVGLLIANLGAEAVDRLLPSATGVDLDLLEKVTVAASKRFNAPLTSSVGSLFDAISALLSICTEAHYHGQAASELENMAGDEVGVVWPVPLRESGGLLELDPRPLMEHLVDGLKQETPDNALAASFHESIAAAYAEACLRIRQAGGPDRVVMSGECLTNLRLDRSLEQRLTAEGFQVFTHRRVPANDGGLCLGQAAVAASRSRPRG